MEWVHIVYIDGKWFINGREVERPDWLGEYPIGNDFAIWVKR